MFESTTLNMKLLHQSKDLNWTLFVCFCFCFFQVISVIKRHPGVQKISFVGHSLGGLVTRYVIAKLYGRDVRREFAQENGECRSDGSKNPCPEEKFKGKIAGLEPMNFITFATPHLGSRGHKQVIHDAHSQLYYYYEDFILDIRCFLFGPMISKIC